MRRHWCAGCLRSRPPCCARLSRPQRARPAYATTQKVAAGARTRVQSAAWTPSPIYAIALLAPPEGGGAALPPAPCLHSCITVRDLSRTRVRRPHAPRTCMRREPLARMHDRSGTHAPPFSRAGAGQYKTRERVYRGGSASRLAIKDAPHLRLAHQGQPHGGNVAQSRPGGARLSR